MAVHPLLLFMVLPKSALYYLRKKLQENIQLIIQNRSRNARMAGKDQNQATRVSYQNDENSEY